MISGAAASPRTGAAPGFDAHRVREDFPIFRTPRDKPLIYLDSAATSQKPDAVLDAMNRYYAGYNANIHRGIYGIAEEATAAYEDARRKVAAHVKAGSPREIIFTRNSTEAINLVAYSWGRANVRAGDAILLTEMEHHSNLVPWQILAAEREAELRYVPVTGDGELDLEALSRLLADGRVKLMGVVHISNVLGTINPVAEMTRRAHAAGALVLVDGAQAVPHLPLDMAGLGADFYVFSGHKMLGPTGIGVLYGRRAVLETLEPAWGGGEMIKEVWIDRAQWNDLPWRFEPGTPPIAAAVGLHAAVGYLDKLGMTRVAAHEQAMTAQCIDALSAIADVTVYGPRNPEIKGAVVAFNVEGIHPHDGAALLDQRGIAVRAGHHCAQPLMKRLGIGGTLRASFSVYTSEADIERLAAAVADMKRDL